MRGRPHRMLNILLQCVNALTINRTHFKSSASLTSSSTSPSTPPAPPPSSPSKTPAQSQPKTDGYQGISSAHPKYSHINNICYV